MPNQAHNLPVSMIKVLSEKLNGWLGTILLPSRHVKIIYKDDRAFTHRGTEDPLTSLVKLRHDDVLLKRKNPKKHMNLKIFSNLCSVVSVKECLKIRALFTIALT